MLASVTLTTAPSHLTAGRPITFPRPSGRKRSSLPSNPGLPGSKTSLSSRPPLCWSPASVHPKADPGLVSLTAPGAKLATAGQLRPDLGSVQGAGLPLGKEAFKPGSEGHHRTASENSAPGISSDLEQALGVMGGGVEFPARLPANTPCQTPGNKNQPRGGSPRKDTRDTR